MATKTTTTLPRFQRLFRGREHAFGQWQKDNVQTVKSEPTEDTWTRHLAGKGPFLGIIPIREDNSCYFGAIDVDDDSIDHLTVADLVHAAKLPLVVCRSKSGGAHLYLFLSDPAPADLVQKQLKAFARHLGFTTNHDNRPIEIFPKQVKLKPTDTGNWINLPYYGSDGTNRYAVTHTGEHLTLLQFLDLAEETAISSAALEAIVPGGRKTFQEGPPCLQQLDEVGFPEGSRNMGLYNVAIYFKLAYPEEWKERLQQYNDSGKVDPPLKQRDLDGVIKSVEGHDYRYKCDDMPIVSFCQKTQCKKQKYGISAFTKQKVQASLPSMGDLRKILTDPPRWILRVDDEDLDLQTDDLMLVPRFRRVVLERCNKLFPIMKQPDWDDIITNLLATLITVEAPEDSGIGGQFRSLFQDFLLRRKNSESVEDLLAGMPWQDGPRVYFRGQDFLAYLERMKFREYPPSKVWSVLKDKYGAGHEKLTVKGAQVRTWYVLELGDDQVEGFTPLSYEDPEF